MLTVLTTIPAIAAGVAVPAKGVEIWTVE